MSSQKSNKAEAASNGGQSDDNEAEFRADVAALGPIERFKPAV